MPSAHSLRSLLLAVSLCCAAGSATAQEWTRFRGPNGSGLAGADRFPTTWTEADYRWQTELPGVGHSSPVLWGDRLFLLAGEEETGHRLVLCCDAIGGKILWRQQFEFAKHPKHQLNSFASSTPAVDAERVYCCWVAADQLIALCLDHAGAEQWRANLGPFRAGHGYGVSPILIDDLVIIGNDQDGDSSVIALDNRTGETRWRVPRKTKAGYSTPCVYKYTDRPAELILTSWERGITALDPQTGRTNWELQVFAQGHVETPIGSPFVAGGLIYGTCGWLGVAIHTVAVRPDPDQPGMAREVFRMDKGAPLTTTPLVVNGLLILWADNGVVTCVDAETGELAWRERVGGTYYGSPIAAGDAIYCLSAEGDAVVLAASREYELLARVPLSEGSHSTPAVAGGRLFLRTFSHLYCLDRLAVTNTEAKPGKENEK